MAISKQVVDWFSHSARHKSRALAILEGRWGNDGYAFWWKLLELLCCTEGHAYVCDTPMAWEYICNEVGATRVEESQAREILNLLASLEAIHSGEWQDYETIWCQNLVDRFNDLYHRRTVDMPTRPHLKSTKPAVRKPKPKLKVYSTDEHEKTFNLFWGKYPNGAGKQPAYVKWMKMKPDEALFAKIMISIELHKLTEQWTKDHGRYVPMAATFLNQERWKDELVDGGKKAWNDWS